MKKLLLMISFLMAGVCYGQNQYIDTVFYKNGKTVICKIRSETETTLIYQTKDQGYYDEWNISKSKIEKYIDNTPGDVSKYNIVKFDDILETKYSNTKNPVTLLTLKDTINYLMNQIKVQKDQHVGVANTIYFAGKDLKTTGIISITGLGLGIVSGACFLIGNYYSQPMNNAARSYAHDAQSWNTIGAVAGAMSGACMLSIPIGLFSAGNKLKKIK